MRRRLRTLGGFTLLEVMVAMMILSLALVAIFSSEAGAIRAGARARAISTATLLARCKMAELEEYAATEGFPTELETGEDACCEGGEVGGFTCRWSLEPVVLPETLGLEGEGGGDLLSGGGLGAPDPGAPPESSIQDALAGGGSTDMLATFALQYAFPVLAPAIAQQVRRATVEVQWREGSGTQSFDVVQYLVADQGLDVGPDTGAGAPPGGGTPAPGAGGSGAQTPGQRPGGLQLPGIR